MKIKDLYMKKGDLIKIVYKDGSVSYEEKKEDDIKPINKVNIDSETIDYVEFLKTELYYKVENKENNMEELKNIVLKNGDRVYFGDNRRITITVDCYDGKTVNRFERDVLGRERITKIERPIKYEAIYEAPKQILTKEEKEWLEHFLKPFKDRISLIAKYSCVEGYEYICIHIKDDTNTTLPDFEKDKYYKGMEIDREYTLKELGLFE